MQDYYSNDSNLQRYSTAELIALAQRLGIDVSPDLDRPFIIDELLEYAPCLNIYQEENPFNPEDFGTTILKSVDNTLEEFETTAELPKQYNLTFIETLVRDPLWVFVYWELRNIEKKQIERQADFEEYFLRVKLFECKYSDGRENLFTVPVGTQDNSRYLNFPPDTPCRTLCKNLNSGNFQVELCASYGKKKSIIASSKPFELPCILSFSEDEFSGIFNNPFIIASGLNDLPILRNIERTLNTHTDRKMKRPTHASERQ
ncbi:MAG: hypothetical protein Ta2B_04240 [Termitinemataceae bacterium]|nr:MAG: hypothetical protein Ta2B_04240 [Termitinemataceae bacterium]